MPPLLTHAGRNMEQRGHADPAGVVGCGAWWAAGSSGDGGGLLPAIPPSPFLLLIEKGMESSIAE